MEVRILIIETIIAVALFIAGLWFAFKDWWEIQILKYLNKRMAICRCELLRCLMNKESIPKSLQREMIRIVYMLDKIKGDEYE